MKDSTVSRLLLILAGLAFLQRPAFAQPAGADSAGQPRKEEEARELFGQGRQLYYQRDYDGAEKLFQKAYALSAAPGFLFNIAQAQRLAGHCQLALASYRLFVEKDPEAVQRAEADERIATLTANCPPVASAVPAAAPTTPEPPAVKLVLATPPPPEPSPLLINRATPAEARFTRTTAAWTTAGSGVALGLIAGGVYLWNNGRFQDWKDEDRRLAMALAPAQSARQDSNDHLWQSIQRVDRGVAVVAALSGVLLATAAVLVLLPHRSSKTESPAP